MQLSRRREPEWMDQLGLNQREHRRALDGLGNIHCASRTVAPLWNVVRQLASTHADSPLTVLDVACGGGHVAMQIARRARASGSAVQVYACDISRTAVRYARRRARSGGVPEVRFFRRDVLQQRLDEQCDVVLCTLFLHHLDEPDAVKLLRAMGAAARRAVLVLDLRRTWFGLGLAWAGCRLLSRSPIVHTDGPRSVRAAFTRDEALQLAAQAGLAGARVSHRWPQTFLIDWRRAGCPADSARTQRIEAG